jgi:hypothetical protein
MSIAGLRRRLAALEGVIRPEVTLEELLGRLQRGETWDDPDFDRRLRASRIGRILNDMAQGRQHEEPSRPAKQVGGTCATDVITTAGRADNFNPRWCRSGRLAGA